MKHRLEQAFVFFYDFWAMLLFVWGAVLTAVVGNSTYALLSRINPTRPVRLSIYIIVSGLFLIVLTVFVLRWRIKSRINPTVGESQAFKIPRKVILFTVGMQSDTIALAIQHQKPEFVGFLSTQRSAPRGVSVADAGRIPEDMRKYEVVDPWDVVDVRAKSQRLIEWASSLPSIQKSDIVFDLTGGLTTMSVGAFVAASDQRIDTQYIRSTYDEGTGKRNEGTEEAICIERFSSLP